MDTYGSAARRVMLVPMRAGRERYPVLQVSPSAMDLLHSCLGIADTDIPGVTFTPPQAESILRHITLQLRRARLRGGPTDEWELMRSAVEINRAASAGRPMIAVMERSAIQEELDHAAQLMATGDFYLNHAGPEGTKSMLGSPSGAKAARVVRATYPDASDSQVVMEIGVRLMRPGRYREMDLTPDEAQDLRELYVDVIVQRHGPERVSEIIRRVESAQSAEKRTRNEANAHYGNGHRGGRRGAAGNASASPGGRYAEANPPAGSSERAA